MIKRLLFYLLFFIPIFKINAQCTCVGNSLCPTSTVTASNTGLTYLISSSIYAGDTSKLTGFTGNKTYKFNSSVAADNLTLRYNSINGLVCDANPITYTFPSSPASLYSLTTHKNTTCGTESISRTTYVTCLDCVSAPANDNCSGAISITPTSGSTCTGVVWGLQMMTHGFLLLQHKQTIQ
ncbi:MAG: hypothetical protein IPL95_12750 [Saprospiraceae bacterium]|nr:hypothetical protein [Saprospiraceae bacterium]